MKEIGGKGKWRGAKSNFHDLNTLDGTVCKQREKKWSLLPVDVKHNEFEGTIMGHCDDDEAHVPCSIPPSVSFLGHWEVSRSNYQGPMGLVGRSLNTHIKKIKNCDDDEKLDSWLSVELFLSIGRGGETQTCMRYHDN